MFSGDEVEVDLQCDNSLMKTMIDRFGGKPVGLDTLAASTGEEATTIEDVYEPYLLQIGFIARTPRGRICLAKAYEHFNKQIPDSIKDMISSVKPQTDN